MPVPVIVLNFGQSVLRSLEDYTDAADEIYRHYRQGQNVVAVTSAQGEQSDVLMAEARRVGPEATDAARNLAELVQLGERRSAALLALALERIGAPAFVRQARDLGLKATGAGISRRDGPERDGSGRDGSKRNGAARDGSRSDGSGRNGMGSGDADAQEPQGDGPGYSDPVDGEPTLNDIDTDQLIQDLTDHDIVVMPGYVGIGKGDRPVLLGAGGADFTALYVAHALRAESARTGMAVRALLLKDVNGVYERDPREAGPAPKRYDRISWEDARVRAGVLIDPRALDFAASRALAFEVGTPGYPRYTRIGEVTEDATVPRALPRLRVAMLGLGTVGGGVWRRIAAAPERFEMVGAMVRDVKPYTDQGYPTDRLFTDIEALMDTRPDVFIDVSGGVEPALSRTRAMIAAGVDVVSANKQAVAEGGRDLIDAAANAGVQLRYSAAAGGGMPVLEMCLRERGRIVSVEALLNGTTNYVLDRITAGATYGRALAEAQDLGFAEADPTADVSGADAAAKIRLVSLLGFEREMELDDIAQDSIADFGRGAAQGAWKRVARIWRQDGDVRGRLELRDLDRGDFLARAEGEEAHAVFTFEDGDVYRIRGKGAGRWPTTAAVMADLYDVAADGLSG